MRTITVPEPGAVRTRVFSGTAQAALETALSFRVGGEIAALPVEIGDAVDTDDLVARLDPTDYELEVKQARARLAQVRAEFENARADYRRISTLWEQRVVSESELDRSRTAFESLQAQVAAASKALDIAQQHLRYTELHAPLRGSIAALPVEAHQTVAAGQTVALLSSGRELEMELGVPDSLISQVHVGDRVRVGFDSLPGEFFSGTVSAVGVETGKVSTYPVQVTLEAEDPRLRPGMPGEVEFDFDLPAGAAWITVPPVAVAGGADGTRHAWVADPDSSTVHRREVRVGDLTSDGLQILAGLEPGELLVVRGVHSLREGMRVRLPDADADKGTSQ